MGGRDQHLGNSINLIPSLLPDSDWDPAQEWGDSGEWAPGKLPEGGDWEEPDGERGQELVLGGWLCQALYVEYVFHSSFCEVSW